MSKKNLILINHTYLIYFEGVKISITNGMKIIIALILIISFAQSFAQQQLPYIKWEKTYGGSEFDILKSIEATDDGGFILSGTTKSVDGDLTLGRSGIIDFWVVKIDNNGTLEWQHTYGGSGDEFLRATISTQDGGYLLGGSSNSNDGDVQSGNKGNDDFWVVKIDNLGNIEWEQSFGGSGDEGLNSLQVSVDGGYLLGGWTVSNDGNIQSGNNGSADIWVIKINETGGIIWEQTYGSIDFESLSYLETTGDGGYILGGTVIISEPGGEFLSDFTVLKIDDQGTIIWQRLIGGSKNESIKFIQPTLDNGFLLAGITSSDDGDIQSGNHGTFPTLDYWIVKINELGEIEWERTYGGSEFDILRAVLKLDKGGYLLGGTTASDQGDIQSGNEGTFDFWVIKIDEDGNIEWEETYGGSSTDIIWAIESNMSGDILLGGTTHSENGDIQSGNKGVSDYWVVNMGINSVPQIQDQSFVIDDTIEKGPSEVLIQASDEDGDGLEYQILSGNESNNFLIQNDGTLEILKNLQNQIPSTYHLQVQVSDGKHASRAQITISLKRENFSDYFQIFPNPVSADLLRIESTFPVGLNLRIIDINGRFISYAILRTGENLLDLKGYKKGLYIIQFIDNTTPFHQEKIVVK